MHSSHMRIEDLRRCVNLTTGAIQWSEPGNNFVRIPLMGSPKGACAATRGWVYAAFAESDLTYIQAYESVGPQERIRMAKAERAWAHGYTA